MDWQTLVQFGNFLISDEFFSVLAVIAVWGFFLSGLDDLFIDVRYMIAMLFSRRRGEDLRMTEVEALHEKPIAVMVPAWKEADVIRAMLMRNVANIDYLNYHIFVGTYKNDLETQREVDAVINYYQRIHRTAYTNGNAALASFIHKVVTPHDGPTNKADNLNVVYKRIKEVEEKLIDAGKMDGPFEVYVLHDCEDVIHPKELKLFNYLMTNKPVDERPKDDPMREQFDFVQVPVFPLEIELKPSEEQIDPARESLSRLSLNPATWAQEFPVLLYQSLRLTMIFFSNLKRYAVSSTYMDEFAEHHTKDMIVRRSIKGLVPSAGVGTGFSRTSLNWLEESTTGGGIFNDVHLTEDYEISLHLKNLGARQHFVVEPVKMLKYRQGRLDRTVEVDEYVATKEYFPDSVKASIRQKARWVMGITYQTMFPGRHDNPFVDFARGWSGNMVTKYTLFRDRKALITNYINILGYIVFLYCLIKLMLVEIVDYEWSFSVIFPPNSYIWWLVLFDTVIMVERYLQRLNATHKIYGLKHSLYFVLRTILLVGLVLGNFINFAATVSATRRYVNYLWDRRFGKDKDKDAEAQPEAEAVSEAPADDADLSDELEEDIDPEGNGDGRAQPAWGKTDHSYLSQDQMREYVNRLGEIALRSRLIDRETLDKALAEQQRIVAETGKKPKLGAVLQQMGYLDELGFSMLYAQQISVPSQEIDPFEIDADLLKLIPEDVAIRFRIVPLTLDEDGNLIVASADPLDEDDRRYLERKLGRRVKTVITYDKDIDFSRRRAYGMIAQQQASQFPRLGVHLIERKTIDEQQLSEALYEQKINRRPLGEVLLEMGAIQEEHLDEYFRSCVGIGFKRIACEMVDMALIESIPRAFCRIHRVLPIRKTEAGIEMATANLGIRQMKSRLEQHFGAPINLWLTSQKQLLEGIPVCYDRIDEEKTRSRLIGSRMVQAGLLSEAALSEALKQQREQKRRLGEILVTFGYCDEDEFLKVYARELFLPVMDLKSGVSQQLRNFYPRSEAVARHIVPVDKTDSSIQFALPYDFEVTDLRRIEERFPMMALRYCLARKQDIKAAIDRLYRGSIPIAVNPEQDAVLDE